MSQEAIYLYKPRTNKNKSTLADRFSLAQPESKSLNTRRCHKYKMARKTVDNVYESERLQHLSSSLSQLNKFSRQVHKNKLPVIVLHNARVSEYTDILTDLEAENIDIHHVTINSTECPNFKIAMKLIVDRFAGDSEYANDKRLTYDFDILARWAGNTNKRLLVFVDDGDSFDFGILRQLMAQMHSYTRTLHFRLVLNLSIPLPLFEDNLTQDNVVNSTFLFIPGSLDTPKFVDRVASSLLEVHVCLKKELVEKLKKLDIVNCLSYLRYAVLAHFAGNPFAVADKMEEVVEIPKFHKLPSINSKSEAQIKEMNPIDIEELQVGGKVLDIAFNPHYRPLIEQSFVNVDMFGPPGQKWTQSNPLACIYQLQRESSVYINIYDLYMAFKQMIQPIPDVNWDKQSMAIFLESVAALKLMGVIRDCKRKFECVEKVAWYNV
ncbi:hypothetical protein DASB73_026990 [Starmerella bacillaris]|uniref:Origin recognition complex subunit 3 n=1 Tax=Starmerella bacillaris TaxID=1247836 RepID=A0AAV5RJM4_STABA|nr:hypothetical protein DASB73_026990 [Starmerella bacillaris]